MHPTLDELLVQFRGLLDAHRAGMAPSRSGEGNLRCDGCLDCNRCRFCVQCVRCNDCSNCELCHDCRACTRSRMSRSCVRSGHLEFCEGCEDSQYLVLCVDCTGCTQCFACVGLKNEEFCVLNQRYSRKDYFPAVQALRRRLEEAIAGGSLLTEIAAIGRGAWPPRGFDIPKEFTAAISAPMEAAAPLESAEVAVDDDVDPWADDAAPSHEPGEAVDREPVAVSWVYQPARPF
ncbi:hypothetical protein OV203_14745 [Nannocystis sp. ILAH1]|uniref:hypothetical protein n=1 Tax=unclassified Nannocystis TaxID=2627009 RepID=UPI002271E1F2|nr:MULTISPECIES: hypothetical protein [unclassified Nannocystis]MCY0988388.1 hypothetical protein [Nannocystis sp. ILAH1]MCY1067651.1 hypothetical protein [Nannocystis sp. RBIL2]